MTTTKRTNAAWQRWPPCASCVDLRAQLAAAIRERDEALNAGGKAVALQWETLLSLRDAIARAEAAERVVENVRDMVHANLDKLRSEKRQDIAWRDVKRAMAQYDAARKGGA